VRRNGVQPASALQQRSAPGKTDTIQALLEKHGPEIAMVLPQHVTPERLLRIAISEVRRNPKLANCSSASLLSAIFSCASLGLEPGGPLGHAYLIPYGQECTFQVGYKGMIDLARRSGQIESLSARAVYQNDAFQYSFGLHEDLVHQPATGDRGQLTHAYAVARLKDGGIQFEVMDRQELEEVRDGSQGYQMAKKYNKKDTPWISSFDEMCRKTVIRRLFKYLPVSVEIAKVVSLDEAADYGRRQESELDHILLPDPTTQAPAPALTAAAAPVATLTEQQLLQIRESACRQLSAVGVAAFEASITQAMNVAALEEISAELHRPLMQRIADPANRDRWDRGCDHLSGEPILTAEQIAELLPQEEEEPQQEEAPAPAPAPAPAVTRKAAPAPATVEEAAEPTDDAQGELV
jgi:recombination protein RecT